MHISRMQEKISIVENSQRAMQSEQEQIMEELTKYQDNLEKLIQKSEAESQDLFKNHDDDIKKQKSRTDSLDSKLKETTSELDRLRSHLQSLQTFKDQQIAKPDPEPSVKMTQVTQEIEQSIKEASLQLH